MDLLSSDSTRTAVLNLVRPPTVLLIRQRPPPARTGGLAALREGGRKLVGFGASASWPPRCARRTSRLRRIGPVRRQIHLQVGSCVPPQ